MSTSQRKTKSPPVQTEMTGAEVVLQVLAEQGVDTIFGYSGGAILPTYDAVFRYNAEHPQNKQIRLLVPANEQGAGFMAAGYARASGKVGCLLVTSGPGATNCVTPIRDCMADSVPVVMISGQVARAAIGTDAFQEAPVFNIMSACAKHVFLVKDVDQLEATMRTAFHIARSGRPGPVVIDLPKDVQNSKTTFKGEGLLHLRGYEKRIEQIMAARLTKTEIDSFFQLLDQSSRPLLYVGGGIISGNAAEELRAFSRHFTIPVVTTLTGIGAMDTNDDLCLHMLGMHGTAYANYAVEDCDMLISVGARFDDRVAGKIDTFAPKAESIAHIDIDPAEIGKVLNVTWSHVGDAKAALHDLLVAGKSYKNRFAPWVKHIKTLKKNHPLNYNRDSDLIQPQYVLECLNELIGDTAIITTGVGQHQMWAAQYFSFSRPRSFITSGSMGTMGFGLPAAAGAQLACPGALVIDVDGDGSLRMNLGELEALTTYDIPVKVLLLNNFGDGMVRQWQRLYFGRRFSGTDKTLHKKDFVKAAEADGFEFARRLDEKSKVKETLKEFISFPGPALLEVLTDRETDVLPMVGPGMSYKEMITGDHIHARPVMDDPKSPDMNMVGDEEDISAIPDAF